MNAGVSELKKHLREHGDQKNIAVRLGIPQDALSRILNGHRLPTVEQRAKFESELGIHWRLWDTSVVEDDSEKAEPSNGGAAA